MDCTTADASLASNESFTFTQRIEGQNLQYLKKGTSSAESLTFILGKIKQNWNLYCRIIDNDNTRHISKSYTINHANTWEKKTITYDGDTTGAFDNDNAKFIFTILVSCWKLILHLVLYNFLVINSNANIAVGQVNLADSTA